jgi:hypothetical protein
MTIYVIASSAPITGISTQPAATFAHGAVNQALIGFYINIWIQGANHARHHKSRACGLWGLIMTNAELKIILMG